MRFKPEHSEKTKAAIVAAAGRRFRRDGYFGVGVDGVAADAGMTSGAVYGQFGSKKKLLEAVLRDGLEGVRKVFAEVVAAGGLADLAARYFRPEHRCDPAGGCPLPSLTADVARAGPEAQAVFAELLPRIADELAKGLPAGGDVPARDRAWATLALMAGGVMLARALPDGPAADEVLEACRRAALAEAGVDRPAEGGR